MQVKGNKDLDFRSVCPLSSALDVIGDKWSLLIIRDIIFFNKKTFGEFSKSMEGIASNILTNRLKRLVELGILSREQDELNKKLYNYSLTEKGEDFVPVMLELMVWADKYLEKHVHPEARKIAQFYVDNREGIIKKIKARELVIGA